MVKPTVERRKARRRDEDRKPLARIKTLEETAKRQDRMLGKAVKELKRHVTGCESAAIENKQDNATINANNLWVGKDNGVTATFTITNNATVVSGNGPCNAQRIAKREAAHTDGAWVREAALAHAAKHESQRHQDDESERVRPTSRSES